ncbi:MAG: YbaB/EbfC family nucleoid-associated protein [Succinivibrionaceae bacterium]|nr:YbaB/EbfC family nucleoid-associated protein [Succinivibrionaceae bacterium]
MFGGFGNIMKQAQVVQEKMKRVKEEIEKLEIEGQAGSGSVKVVISGRHIVRKVTIDPSLKDDDIDMIEDLVAAAFNDATTKLEAESKARMEKASAGLPLPKGIMDML